jgi:hypothetical protein
MRIALLLLLSACATPLVRFGAPVASAVPPAIVEVVDLGGLPLPASGEVERRHSDGALSAGEWVALLGDGLDASARVSVDGQALAIEGFLRDGGLLVRVPRGLSPLEPHTLRVETAHGMVQRPLSVTTWAVAADTDGDAVRLARLVPGHKDVFAEPTEIALRRAKHTAQSPDGALLYVIQTPKDGRAELIVVHLAAKGGPEALASLEVATPSPPAGLLAVGTTLLVLGERHLLRFDVSDPTAPRAAGVLELTAEAQRVYVDLAPLGPYVAALETWGNRVDLIDVASLSRVGSVDVAPEMQLPYAIDLAPAPGGASLWVLAGPNFRVAGKRVAELTRGIVGDEASAPAAAPQLLEVGLDGAKPVVLARRGLPDGFYPLFALAEPTGDVIVSGVGGAVLDVSQLDLSLDGLKKLVTLVGDLAQFGRIVRVPAAGAPQTVIEGLALYLNLDRLAGGQLVYAAMRIGAKPFPPSLKVDWGIETASRGYAPLRSLGAELIIPPYSYGHIEVLD